MPLVIRLATDADRPALDEQEQGLNLFENQLLGDRQCTRAAAAAAMDRLIQRATDTGGGGLVAELNGAVVGHLVLTFERMGPYIRDDLRDHAHIADLFVRAAQRNQGIGTALMAEAERRAIARGVPRITLGVVHGNTGAERAYRRAGYRTYALEMVKDLSAT